MKVTNESRCFRRSKKGGFTFKVISRIAIQRTKKWSRNPLNRNPIPLFALYPLSVYRRTRPTVVRFCSSRIATAEIGMRKPTNDARGNVPAALWSELIALWRASARRPTWPLLMALLLFVSAPLTASMDCSLEAGGHSHAAEASDSHHHADEDSGAPHHSDEASDHHDHAQVAAQGATLQAPATCCSCSSEPVNATVVAVNSPQQHKADSHAVIYAAPSLLPTYRFDSLHGLNTRAGPPTGKPQRLSLVSHIGPAPPIFL